MPFDALPQEVVSDLVKLRIALDGVRQHWRSYRVGSPRDAEHCAIGWLLVAADWDRDEATRLALEYVYPALPEKARKKGRLASVWIYNDTGGRKRIVQLFADAARLAEQRAVR